MADRKKAFFIEATKTETKRKTFVETLSIVDAVHLEPSQYMVVPEFVPRGFESARKFMKHGPEVKPKRFYSLRQAIQDGRVPLLLREEAFNSINGHDYCGYSFLPISKDQRKRKVSLIECLEGARIFAYANQNPGTYIKVKPYADAKRVRIEGAEVVVEVPSRTEDQRRIKFKLTSVPMIDSPEKYGISQNIGSDHSCGSKRFNIRYRYSDDKESSAIVNICAHEIAGYLQLIQDEINEKKNLVPLMMCQFAIPSQETVDYYLKLENNVLVRDESLEVKDKLRKLNRAEKEIALWALVENYGHDRTFYAGRSKDGNVRDYNWGI